MTTRDFLEEEEYRKFYDWIAELANMPEEEGDNLRRKLRFYRPLLDQCNSWQALLLRLDEPE